MGNLLKTWGSFIFITKCIVKKDQAGIRKVQLLW